MRSSWVDDCHGDTYDTDAGRQRRSTRSATPTTARSSAASRRPTRGPRSTRWPSRRAPTGRQQRPDAVRLELQGPARAVDPALVPRLGLRHLHRASPRRPGGRHRQRTTSCSAASSRGSTAGQQGLVRFAVQDDRAEQGGPDYADTVRSRRPPPGHHRVAVTGHRPGRLAGVWDRDNQRLTYEVYRMRGTANAQLVTTLTADTDLLDRPDRSSPTPAPVRDPHVPDPRHRPLGQRACQPGRRSR